MIVERITVSMFATNCYLVACPETKESVIIDPGADGKGIAEKVRTMGLSVKKIINTHAHVDHIGANGRLKEIYKVPIILNKKDLELYKNPGFALNLFFRNQPEPDVFVSEGDRIDFGKLSMQVLETPGHTPGGICFVVNNAVFCGDTLFASSVGRADLAGGSHFTLIKSICEKLMVLPLQTVVYPGHGPSSTIGAEAASNPFVDDSHCNRL